MQYVLAIISLALPILIFGLISLVIKINKKLLSILLTISASYLFSISIIHLLPEAFTGGNYKTIGLFIVLGFCLQLFIDTFSTGIEHGHVHLHSHSCSKHLPYGIIFGLFLHSFLEGLPVYNSNSTSNETLINYQIIYGLALHNIPIAITFSALLIEHKTSKIKHVFYIALFSAMAPIGFLLGFILTLLGITIFENFNNYAFAIVIGIFLQLSTAIMFESSEQHKYKFSKIIALFVGIVLAYIIS
ncbi:MAG: ZIP family metal transporter [Bacteroidetes bacterium]|nr:ZIP family metal transporter [Bacteroidota bacterium]